MSPQPSPTPLAPNPATAASPSQAAVDDDDEVVLPNMVPCDEPEPGRHFYYQFPPWPKVPGMLRIDQFEPQGLERRSWPAGTPQPEPEDGDDSDGGLDVEENENAPHGLDGSGVPTVHLNIEHFLDRKKRRKNRSKKPRAPRMQMLRKGIVRTEDLFGPGGWAGHELVETRGKEPYDPSTPALLRLQRAAREYESSRVHVINNEQILMQIWANFQTFAQLKMREKKPETPAYDDDDFDLDYESDSASEQPHLMSNPEAGLYADEEPELTSRFLDDMVGTVRRFLSSVYREKGLHWHDGQLDAGPHVVWSFVKYVKEHGVLPEACFVTAFAEVQAVCEQARGEMRLTKETATVFEDGFNLVCSRIWGKRLNEGVERPWEGNQGTDDPLAAAASLSIADESMADASDTPDTDSLDDGDVNMLQPSPARGPYQQIGGSIDDSPTDPEVDLPDPDEAIISLKWETPGGAGYVPGTHGEPLDAGVRDPWDPSAQPDGWELAWDVSEYTMCQPTTFLNGVLGGGSVSDAEWSVAAEQETLMRIVAVGQSALVGRPAVADHFLLASDQTHKLAPVVLEYWTRPPAPFPPQHSSPANSTPMPSEAFLPAGAGGKALAEVVVWIEQAVAEGGKVKEGMGMLAALKWVRHSGGRAFWFVDSVPIVISDFWLASPTTTVALLV